MANEQKKRGGLGGIKGGIGGVFVDSVRCVSCAFLLSLAPYKIAPDVRPTPIFGEEGGGIWGGDDVLRLDFFVYLSLFFNKSLQLMDFGQVIDAILILFAIRELREYRKDRKSSELSRKDADNGKTNRSSR